MSIFSGKGEEEFIDLLKEKAKLEAKLEVYDERLNDYRSQIVSLEKQVTNLQNALVSKEAPNAYQDAKETEEILTEDQKEEIKKQKRAAEINRELLDNMEAPLFVDADDMFELLTTTSGAPEADSVHDNQES
jgi:chromosome segregation ATPase